MGHNTPFENCLRRRLGRTLSKCPRTIQMSCATWCLSVHHGYSEGKMCENFTVLRLRSNQGVLLLLNLTNQILCQMSRFSVFTNVYKVTV